MRRRSWQRGYWPGLLVALVVVGCLSVFGWQWQVSRAPVEGVSDDGAGVSLRSEAGESSRRDSRDTVPENDDGAATVDAQGSAPRATENGVSVSVQTGELEQVATHLLTSYRDTQDCVLASSGYLDLLGLVWGCVVQGDGWVDVCIVAQGEVENTSKVSVLHMDASELADVFGADDATP